MPSRTFLFETDCDADSDADPGKKNVIILTAQREDDIEAAISRDLNRNDMRSVPGARILKV